MHNKICELFPEKKQHFENDELMKTIYIPKNLASLTENLPKPNYEHEEKINEIINRSFEFSSRNYRKDKKILQTVFENKQEALPSLQDKKSIVLPLKYNYGNLSNSRNYDKNITNEHSIDNIIYNYKRNNLEGKLSNVGNKLSNENPFYPQPSVLSSHSKYIKFIKEKLNEREFKRNSKNYIVNPKVDKIINQSLLKVMKRRVILNQDFQNNLYSAQNRPIKSMNLSPEKNKIQYNNFRNYLNLPSVDSDCVPQKPLMTNNLNKESLVNGIKKSHNYI